MARRSNFTLSFTLIILVVGLVCIPGTTIAAPELPGGPVPVSEEAADQLDDKIVATYMAAYEDPDGAFTLNVTDEEATSWFVYRVATEAENNIADPQIRFADGKIHSAMTIVGMLPFELRIKIVAVFQMVDDQVNFEIESSSAGFLPIPKPIMDFLPQTETVNEILQETGIELTGIDTLEGELVLQGHLLPE